MQICQPYWKMLLRTIETSGKSEQRKWAKGQDWATWEKQENEPERMKWERAVWSELWAAAWLGRGWAQARAQNWHVSGEDLRGF